MSNFAKDTTATIIPGMRYQDAPAAIEWLCNTFGFEKQLVVPNDDDTIAHAQLTFGNSMIMLGSVRAGERDIDKNIKQPEAMDGDETLTHYLVVTDADAIYDQSKEAGAEIVMAIKDEDCAD